MQKKYRISYLISIYLATGILLLHTFIPHSHTEEYRNYSEISCDLADRCILDFLGVVLDHNFGEDHLERFQVNENHFQDLTFDMDQAILVLEEKYFVKGDILKKYAHIDPVVDHPVLKLYHYRGPPIYS